MKYGSQLPSRSVPEWRAHNILYNDLKDEIKRTTSKTVTHRSYQALLQLFIDEFNNVGLFVKSKMGEIDRRIATCASIVETIAEVEEHSDLANDEQALDHDPDQDRKVKETKMYQLHREIAKLTRDMQQLSRFTGAQYTGFRKLIKKYRKWVSPDAPQLTEFEEMLNSPDSFARIDFTPSFLELSLLYDIIRSGKFTSLKSSQSWAARKSSPANTLCQFDVAVACAPSQSIRFWVHDEDVMEVKVQILQHLALVYGDDQAQVTTAMFLDTPQHDYASSRKEPGQVRQVKLFGDEGSDSASRASEASPAGHADSTELSAPVLCAPTGGMRHFTATELTPKTFDRLKRGKLTANDADANDTNSKLALGWVINKHARVQVTVDSTRYRYQSVPEETSTSEYLQAQQVWATIDSQISVHGAKDDGSVPRLPHSVLEIRWTGLDKLQWVAELEKSHLVYPISSSFSLFTFGLYSTQPETFHGIPRWVQVLEDGQDIRRAPKQARPMRSSRSRLSLRPRGAHSSILLNNDAPSLEEDDGESSSPQRDTPRYWNEFDNPEDEDDNVFSVFVDDQDEALQRALRAEKYSQPLVRLSKSVRRSVRQVRSILGMENEFDDTEFSEAPSETQSLLGNYSTDPQYSPRLSPTRIEQGAVYSHEPDPRYDIVMTMATAAAYTLSVITTGMVYAILFSEDIEDLNFGVRAVVVAGLTFSIMLAALGAFTYNLRSARSWTSQVLVQAVWFSVVCFGVGGMAWVLTT